MRAAYGTEALGPELIKLTCFTCVIAVLRDEKPDFPVKKDPERFLVSLLATEARCDAPIIHPLRAPSCGRWTESLGREDNEINGKAAGGARDETVELLKAAKR